MEPTVSRFEPVEPAIIVLLGIKTTQYFHHSMTQEYELIFRARERAERAVK